jgi:hypothetical protein
VNPPLSDSACLTATMSESRVRESRTHGSIGGPLAKPETRTTSGLPHGVPVAGGRLTDLARATSRSLGCLANDR